MKYCDDWHLRLAARTVARGGIIAYPTEAVFGLGCDPRNIAALLRLVAIKGRAANKGFIVIAGNVDQLDDLVRYPSATVRKRVLATWPGPVTWVLPSRPDLPLPLTGGRGTLAVRVTAHATASALCRIAGPLVSTSANLSGHRPAHDLLRVRGQFCNYIDYFVPGRVGAEAGPTEIRDAQTGRVLRAGSGPSVCR
ncbi:MAG: L-threonylcarbamoyladenylate synthase [Chromatiales bacterium]